MRTIRNASDYAYFDAPFSALAHRGGWDDRIGEELENSLAAFQHAVDDLGYRYVETDVHATSDGELLAFHDMRLDRVTDHRGAIAELDWAQVRTARIGGREPIPTMDEVFEALPEARINIDIKEPNAIAPLARAIRRHNAYDRVCVASFSPRRLAAFRRAMGPRVATSASLGAVAWSSFVPLLPRFVNAGVQAFQIPVRQRIGPVSVKVLTRNLLRTARERDMRVHVWTVDDPDQMRSLMDAGVDGIVSNRIDELKALCTDRDLW
ncbi:glycerophosphodiester phosphodiesterase [Propionibacterium australiense]|uniref:Glycerophosphodiester phosphodiesterase n=1 Tax=Propionibacterium australiense TaxID=119981 RepID=A0A383S449_9ACTN|nr:glycerophosphodiester phosphodiesterase [Propionibacterium australiense]RLP11609.1 glycerophosphodiester phosphodiesterase [Propionibacterium australiense]RLP12122.1 glycerophosphodiester phosphodiesterase [Propionibacterium australiense]SYZ32332.1 Glycerophosphodiester phosphodiesterase domain [Propionibacterium australiense]VEH90421.1 Glycerophosphoryl diester phosphodiesterase [Propionibacterium australiense]